MTLRQIINIVTLTLAFLLLAPAGLILASWNSLPGDSLYPTKRTLEKVALALLSPSYQTQTSLQTKLITRRLDEATATIDQKSSSRGLAELKVQLQAAQTQVAQAPSQEAKTQATQKVVGALILANRELEEKKQDIARTTPGIESLLLQTPTHYLSYEDLNLTEEPAPPKAVVAPALLAPTPPSQSKKTAGAVEAPAEIVHNIETAQQQVDKAIKDTIKEAKKLEKEDGKNNESGLCKNTCGDGACQEVVCLGQGCPCPENSSSCPTDCSKRPNEPDRKTRIRPEP